LAFGLPRNRFGKRAQSPYTVKRPCEFVALPFSHTGRTLVVRRLRMRPGIGEAMNESLSDELQKIVSPGLARDPIRHAEQIATIAGVLYRAFDDSGLRSVVVGGSAIEIHAPGTYVSGDIDLVVERLQQQDVEIDDVFSSLGFQRKGRHWRIGDLFVEVPSRILSDPSEVMRVGNAVFEVVRREVVLADRIVGFRQWEVHAWGQQAIDLLAAFGDDLDEGWLRRKLESEGSLDALDPLRTLAESQEPVSREVLDSLLGELRRDSGTRR